MMSLTRHEMFSGFITFCEFCDISTPKKETFDNFTNIILSCHTCYKIFQTAIKYRKLLQTPSSNKQNINRC